MELNRIAYVEDEDDIRELTEFALTELGAYKVRTYANGHDALDHLANFMPDLILLDVMMPEMDGKTLFKHLKTNEDLARVPVVFMTAKALSAEKQELTDLGAVGVISKPYDPMTLPEDVRTLWSKAHSIH